MATTAYPASDKQLAFINSLIGAREIPVAGKTPDEATVLARIEDVMGGKPVAKHEASACIDYLLKQPKKVVATGPLAELPLSKYALVVGGDLRFYEVVQRASGKRYLNGLVGAPGDFARRDLQFAERQVVVAQLLANPVAAIAAFGKHFVVCGKCSSPLTDEVSRELGIGPVCRGKL